MENLNNLKSNQLDVLKKQYRTLLDKYNCHGFAYYDSSNQSFDLPIYIGNVHEHTIYEAASLTKVMFAYLVLKLSIDNIIDLNTPLVKYVTLIPSQFKSALYSPSPRHIQALSIFNNFRILGTLALCPNESDKYPIKSVSPNFWDISIPNSRLRQKLSPDTKTLSVLQ